MGGTGTAGTDAAKPNPATNPTGFAGSRAAVSNAATPSWAGILDKTPPGGCRSAIGITVGDKPGSGSGSHSAPHSGSYSGVGGLRPHTLRDGRSAAYRC